MDFTMHHPHHHHHHHHHHPGGASSSGSAARCPALRAAAEQRNYQLPTTSQTRGSVHYDPVHGNASNRNMWQSRSPQNWRPAMMPSPLVQDPFMMGTFPGLPPTNQPVQQQPPYPIPNIQNAPNAPEPYPSQAPSFQQFRPTMHPVPRLLSQPSYHGSGGFAGSNLGQGSGQHPSNRPTHRANARLATPNSIRSVPPVQVPTSRSSAPPVQMGQATPFNNENIRPSQQTSGFTPRGFTNQGGPAPFSQQAPESTVQARAAVEDSSPRPASHSPAVPASTGTQRNDDQSRLTMNPVEIRRASTAAMGRPRRSMSRYTAPSDWLGENAGLFRRGDMSLMEFVESFPGAISDGEGPISGQQFFRGSVSGKRVASKKALAALQSVNIADLPESERTCVICYNDFGVANPEGINEAPLRLPKCKHVFGDHCIKKWFEESDSCPYCRDKVPSEPQHMGPRRAHSVLRFMRHYQVHPPHLIPAPGEEQNQPRDREASESETSAQPGQSVPVNTTDRSSSLFSDVGPNSRSPSGSRRFENNHLYGMRPPSWNATPERRSPPIEYDRRRRTRPRVRVSPPSTRPSMFGGPTSNSASQTSVRPSRSSRSRSPFDPMSSGVDSSSRQSLTNSPQQYHWNGSSSPITNQRESTTSNTPSGPAFEVPSFPFQPHIGVPPDEYFRALASPSPDALPANDHPSVLPQMRPDPVRSSPSTSRGPEVYVANSSHAPNQFTSYQQS
ncbi:hypothetical protein F5Y19DRAFT_474365 [Xylariaceae sp. FL1651]|nr:hypothetical protein F5Y19DRAFT_474365 [Xylariaceae sp. FL1651]